MSRFNDVREPIEYVVNQYFEKRKTLSSNMDKNHIGPVDSSYVDDNLPEYPLLILRNEEGKAYKFIYGNIDALENDEEADPIIWQEELVRENNIVVAIRRTYPDGEEVVNDFIRDDGKLVKIE